jgi:hypothetical protein
VAKAADSRSNGTAAEADCSAGASAEGGFGAAAGDSAEEASPRVTGRRGGISHRGRVRARDLRGRKGKLPCPPLAPRGAVTDEAPRARVRNERDLAEARCRGVRHRVRQAAWRRPVRVQAATARVRESGSIGTGTLRTRRGRVGAEAVLTTGSPRLPSGRSALRPCRAIPSSESRCASTSPTGGGVSLSLVADPPGAPKLIHPGAGMVIHP